MEASKITLGNYSSLFSADLQKKAKATKVRECDEVDKNCFVAYVDDGNETYDVTIKIGKGKVVEKHDCDCGGTIPFCKHKIALLQHIEADPKPEKKVKKVAKLSPTAILLESADTEKLKLWVLELIKKNKDIELSFVHHFSEEKKKYTPEEIWAISLEAVKAVIGRRKNIEAGEVKKIVDVWTTVHSPIIDDYLADVSDKSAFVNFNAIIDIVLSQQMGYAVSSNKFMKYIESLLLKIIEPINKVVYEPSWELAVGHFNKKIFSGDREIKKLYLTFLTSLLTISSDERKAKLSFAMLEQFKIYVLGEKYQLVDYNLTMLSIAESNDLFSQYHTFFKPLYFQNDYNIKLIKILIEHDYYELAEQFCKEQINNNSNNKFDYSYFILLKKIYTSTMDDKKLAYVYSVMFNQTYDFNEYNFILEHIQGEENKKKWMKSVRHNALMDAKSNNKKAMNFYFELLNSEKEFKKMLDTLTNFRSYELILKFFEPMYQANKKSFLEAIIMKSYSYSFSGGKYKGEKEDTLEELLQKVIKFYSLEYITTLFEYSNKTNLYGYENPFLTYSLDRLPELNGRTSK
jgi:hypothetical protein